MRSTPAMLLAAALLAACAASDGRDEPAASELVEPAPAALEGQTPDDAVAAPPTEIDPATPSGPDGAPAGEGDDKVPLLDRTQQTVYEIVDGSARWVDGFFSTGELASDNEVTRGLVSVGSFWDERDGTKLRLRLKARVPLPALKRRARLIFGRGDVDEFVDGNDMEKADTLPGRFNDLEDDDWLLGVGVQRGGKLSRGWDFGAGIRLTAPVDPYVRATYRWYRTIGDAMVWRVSPRVFWQSERGEGVSLTNIFDYALGPALLLRSWTILTAEEQVEGMGWTTKLTGYQSLTDRDAIGYGVFATGENRNEVPLQDYGIEFRYRRRVAREWLLVELLTRVSWPREFIDEPRELNYGVGVEFEMRFGDWSGVR